MDYREGGWRGKINNLLEPIVVAISCDEKCCVEEGGVVQHPKEIRYAKSILTE